MTKILLIDDDIELTALLQDLLGLEGFDVDVANDGLQGLSMITAQTQMILLDVMMPILNGMETLRRIREHWETPVLMLTAKNEEIDRVMGLELGADDYLPKPFSDRELLARMRAILRRTSKREDDENDSGNTSQDKLEYQDLVVYLRRMEVFCQGKQIEMTGTEVSMLGYLMQQVGTIVSKSEISIEVLGKKLTPYDRAIDMHISNIRKKLPERSDGISRIKTLRGRGYLFVEA